MLNNARTPVKANNGTAIAVKANAPLAAFLAFTLNLLIAITIAPQATSNKDNAPADAIAPCGSVKWLNKATMPAIAATTNVTVARVLITPLPTLSLFVAAITAASDNMTAPKAPAVVSNRCWSINDNPINATANNEIITVNVVKVLTALDPGLKFLAACNNIAINILIAPTALIPFFAFSGSNWPNKNTITPIAAITIATPTRVVPCSDALCLDTSIRAIIIALKTPTHVNPFFISSGFILPINLVITANIPIAIVAINIEAVTLIISVPLNNLDIPIIASNNRENTPITLIPFKKSSFFKPPANFIDITSSTNATPTALIVSADLFILFPVKWFNAAILPSNINIAVITPTIFQIAVGSTLDIIFNATDINNILTAILVNTLPIFSIFLVPFKSSVILLKVNINIAIAAVQAIKPNIADVILSGSILATLLSALAMMSIPTDTPTITAKVLPMSGNLTLDKRPDKTATKPINAANAKPITPNAIAPCFNWSAGNLASTHKEAANTPIEIAILLIIAAIPWYFIDVPKSLAAVPIPLNADPRPFKTLVNPLIGATNLSAKSNILLAV